MSQLRIIENLKIEEEIDNVALKAKLICECSCKNFYLSHSGKQKKFTTKIVKFQKQMVIKAKCECCGNEITIYDSTIDGSKPNLVEKQELKPFILKNEKASYEITMLYNYYPENYKTNKFVDCFIEISNANLKTKRIFEE